MPRLKRRARRTHSQTVLNSVRSRKSFAPALGGESILQKMQLELRSSQSLVNIVLGLLIVIVAGILAFNYFKKQQPSLGPASQTVSPQESQKAESGQQGGKYIVKEGDTLYKIAQAVYADGSQFTKLAEANKITDVDFIVVGQELDLPKIEVAKAGTTEGDNGTGGAVNQTIWGERISGDTYTVVEGDWLSKIAGRAYGDVMAFDRIAEANSISNPDLIEVGTVLKIPR